MRVRRKVNGQDVSGAFSSFRARFFFFERIASRDKADSFRRHLFSYLLYFLLMVAWAGASDPVLGQHSHASAPPPPAPAPHVSAPEQRSSPSGAGRSSAPAKAPGQQHLNEWLKQNQGLSAQEQVSRLQHEPGFNRLPPEQQQRLVQRLRQVDQMPPEQRQRVLEHIENMERLSPQQQQAVRWSASRLGQLPPYRQQAVREAIRNLRDVPPPYRQSQLYSPRYAGQLTPEELGIVGNLLMVESYHAPAAPPPR